jgi:hypothetical protein
MTTKSRPQEVLDALEKAHPDWSKEQLFAAFKDWAKDDEEMRKQMKREVFDQLRKDGHDPLIYFRQRLHRN